MSDAVRGAKPGVVASSSSAVPDQGRRLKSNDGRLRYLCGEKDALDDIIRRAYGAALDDQIPGAEQYLAARVIQKLGGRMPWAGEVIELEPIRHVLSDKVYKSIDQRSLEAARRFVNDGFTCKSNREVRVDLLEQQRALDKSPPTQGALLQPKSSGGGRQQGKISPRPSQANGNRSAAEANQAGAAAKASQGKPQARAAQANAPAASQPQARASQANGAAASQPRATVSQVNAPAAPEPTADVNAAPSEVAGETELAAYRRAREKLFHGFAQAWEEAADLLRRSDNRLFDEAGWPKKVEQYGGLKDSEWAMLVRGAGSLDLFEQLLENELMPAVDIEFRHRKCLVRTLVRHAKRAVARVPARSEKTLSAERARKGEMARCLEELTQAIAGKTFLEPDGLAACVGKAPLDSAFAARLLASAATLDELKEAIQACCAKLGFGSAHATALHRRLAAQAADGVLVRPYINELRQTAKAAEQRLALMLRDDVLQPLVRALRGLPKDQAIIEAAKWGLSPGVVSDLRDEDNDADGRAILEKAAENARKTLAAIANLDKDFRRSIDIFALAPGLARSILERSAEKTGLTRDSWPLDELAPRNALQEALKERVERYGARRWLTRMTLVAVMKPVMALGGALAGILGAALSLVETLLHGQANVDRHRGAFVAGQLSYSAVERAQLRTVVEATVGLLAGRVFDKTSTAVLSKVAKAFMSPQKFTNGDATAVASYVTSIIAERLDVPGRTAEAITPSATPTIEIAKARVSLGRRLLASHESSLRQQWQKAGLGNFDAAYDLFLSMHATELHEITSRGELRQTFASYIGRVRELMHPSLTQRAR